MTVRCRSSVFRLGVLAHDLLHFSDVDVEELARKFVQTKHPTVLKYAFWLTQSQMYFGCAEQVSRLYFETFLLVHNKSGRAVASVSQPLGGSNTGTGSSGSSSPAPPGSASASAGGLGRPLLSVDYSEFLLFLFIQKYRHWQYVFRRRRSAAAALAAASSKTPKPDMKKSDTEEEREMVLEFVIQHLPTLIRLARDPQKQLIDVASRTNPNTLIESHEFDRLRFILTGIVAPQPTSNGKPALPLIPPMEVGILSGIAPFWALANNTASTGAGGTATATASTNANANAATAAAGSNSAAPAATITAVTEWLTARLSAGLTTPRGPTGSATGSSPHTTKAVAHSAAHSVYRVVNCTEVDGATGNTLHLDTQSINHAAAAAAAAASGSSGSGGASPRSIQASGSTPPAVDVCIRNCKHATIYVTGGGPSRLMYIADCDHCVIQTGVVSGLLRIDRCKHITVMGVSRALHVSDITDSRLYLYVTGRPVLMGHNRCSLAPYHSHYPNLYRDLSTAHFVSSLTAATQPQPASPSLALAAAAAAGTTSPGGTVTTASGGTARRLSPLITGASGGGVTPLALNSGSTVHGSSGLPHFVAHGLSPNCWDSPIVLHSTSQSAPQQPAGGSGGSGAGGSGSSPSRSTSSPRTSPKTSSRLVSTLHKIDANHSAISGSPPSSQSTSPIAGMQPSQSPLILAPGSGGSGGSGPGSSGGSASAAAAFVEEIDNRPSLVSLMAPEQFFPCVYPFTHHSSAFPPPPLPLPTSPAPAPTVPTTAPTAPTTATSEKSKESAKTTESSGSGTGSGSGSGSSPTSTPLPPCECNPFTLPPAYARAVSQRKLQTLKARALLDSLEKEKFTEKQRTRVSNAVQNKFMQWLSAQPMANEQLNNLSRTPAESK